MKTAEQLRAFYENELRDDLGGVAGTYRLTDGHWTELGTEIVADRLSRQLLKVRKERYAP